jgi:hypothetical protein
MRVYIPIATLVIGGIIVLAARKSVIRLVNRFKSQAPLIQKYWLVIVPYSILLISAYAIVWRYFYGQTNFDILGQVAAISLAIFIGYIAFTELSETRFDKHVQAGANYSQFGSIKSAIMELEAADAIRRKDPLVLGNLLEYYLIMGDFDKFDKKVEAYRASIIEENETLSYFYLKALRNLLKEHLSEARTTIAECVAFVSAEPDIRNRYRWSFKELYDSASYKNLNTNTKKILDNLIKYLQQSQQKQLTPDQETKFNNGEYDFL